MRAPQRVPIRLPARADQIDPPARVLNFPGDGYATTPAWTPASALWSIEARIRAGAPTGTNRAFIGGRDEGTGEGFKLTGYLNANNMIPAFQVPDASDTSQYVQLPSDMALEVDTWYTITLKTYPDRVEIYRDGVLGGTVAGDFTDLSRFRLARIGEWNTTIRYQGMIASIRLIDHTPLQGCRVMPGNGTDRYAAIPEITLAGDFEIEFEVGVPSVTTDHPLLGRAGDDRSFVRISPSQVSVNFTAAGAAAAADHGVVSGQHIHVQIRGVDGFLDAIKVDGAEKALSGEVPHALESVIFDYVLRKANVYGDLIYANLRIHDLETGAVYEYDNRNDSGNLLVNRSTRDVLGEEHPERGAGAGQIAGEREGDTITFPGPPEQLYSEWSISGLEPGALYLVQGEAFNMDDGQVISHNGGDNFPVIVGAGQNGPFAKVYKPEGQHLNLYAAIYNKSGLPIPGIRNFSLRRIHALATAEGEELWSFSNMGTIHDSAVITETATGFTFDGTLAPDGESSERSYFNFPSPTGGRFYRARGRLKSHSSGNGVILFARDGTDGTGTILHSTSALYAGDYFDLTVQAANNQLTLLFDGNGVDQYEFEDLSFKEVTHGIWHEAGAPMTDADADAARELLPMISDTYLLDTPGEVKSLMRGDGPELAGDPYVIAEDWTDNGDGSYTLNTDGSTAQALSFQSSASQSGKIFRVVFVLEEITGDGLAVNNPVSQVVSDPGYHRMTVSGDDGVAFKRSSGAVTATISQISIRETNDGLLNNLDETNWDVPG